MSDARTKSVGFLIDELITVSQKCWWAQEAIMDENLTESERLQAAIRAQEMNNLRNRLIRAIDSSLNQEDLSPTTKTYHTYFERKK